MENTEVVGRAEELSCMDAGAVVEIEMNRASALTSQRRVIELARGALTESGSGLGLVAEWAALHQEALRQVG